MLRSSKSFVSKSWTPTRSTSSDFTLTAYLRYHAFAICGGNFERVSPTECWAHRQCTTFRWVAKCACGWMVSMPRDPQVKGASKEIQHYHLPWLTDPNSKETQLELKKRLGFIKLAICQGPYVRLRRKWLYNMWTPSKSVTDFFRKTFGIPVLIFWGKFWVDAQGPSRRKALRTRFMPNSYVRLRIFKQYKSEFDYEDDETLAII
ncbi:hypothetical protein PC129_g14059 [Phytophthora cactorum]|uniref:Uncharacterized protein n=3 Tax=Phytophthora cactorum TaxID=29920 RepID=A0A8T1ES26_9STRA|nr:hypothetical protein PC117_g1233 [Phytophthora cactorum]KAG2987065.1 hypothetical protein PC118_g7469 [Phytophthora cactorum]KAG3041359.1 hypothetical protein PC119_g743 [Phytophthora cactorum]KAG3189168.1 hypothetical protein C6341_g2351 [Phytophthora cactorum]KAG3215058.1 hypothetical protein PC129_g14059 [Phytophthora cactorum]